MNGADRPGAGPLRSVRNGLTRTLEWVVMGAVLVLTLDVLWGVFSRYFLGAQSRWTEELARVLLIWIALLGAAVAFSLKAHLGLDFFVGLLTPAARRLMRIVADLIVLGFTASVMVWGGIRLVVETFRLEQMMMALPFAKGYVYLAVPLSGAFILLFTLEMLVEDLQSGAPPAAAGGGA